MSNSFFSRIRTYFSESYGGRYMELIIKELMMEAPEIIKCFFPNIKTSIIKDYKNIDVYVEKRLSNGRQADLVVLYKGVECCYLEIKYDDKLLDGQLSDYLCEAKLKNVNFTYLTMYHPDQIDIEMINSEKNKSFVHLLYSDVYRGINNNPMLMKNKLIKMFCEFLEETIMIYNKEIIDNNDESLLLLVKNCLNTTREGRNTTKSNVLIIPEIWDALLTNLCVIGDHLYSNNREFISRRPLVYFKFAPFYKKNSLENKDRFEDNYFYPEAQDVAGGYFYVYMHSSLQVNDKRGYGLTYGYQYVLDGNELQLSMHTEAYGPKKQFCEDSRELNNFPDEKQCYTHLIKQAKLVLDEFIKIQSDSLNIDKKTISQLKLVHGGLK